MNARGLKESHQRSLKLSVSEQFHCNGIDGLATAVDINSSSSLSEWVSFFIFTIFNFLNVPEEKTIFEVKVFHIYFEHKKSVSSILKKLK